MGLSKNEKRFLIVVGTGVVALLASMVVMNNAYRRHRKDTIGEQFAAKAACEQAVRERLKSPSSAEFPHEYPSEVRPGTYRMRSHVDSQNGFGAMLRSTFDCEAVGAGRQAADWRVSRLDLQ